MLYLARYSHVSLVCCCCSFRFPPILPPVFLSLLIFFKEIFSRGCCFPFQLASWLNSSWNSRRDVTLSLFLKWFSTTQVSSARKPLLKQSLFMSMDTRQVEWSCYSVVGREVVCSSIGSSREALLAKTSDWQTFMTLIVFENSRMK